MTQKLSKKEMAVLRWARSIEAFVDEVLTLGESRGPSRQQREVLQDIDNGETDIAVKSGHGTGKTTLLSWVILWAGLFKNDGKIPCTAPTAPQLVRLLWPEVRKWREKLPIELRTMVDVKNDSIEFRKAFAVARTARKEEPEALQGFHATWLIWIIDEASGIPKPIFDVIDGSLTGEKHIRILTGNPTRPSGYFYDAFHKFRSLWRLHTFNAEESENVTPESIERKRIQYGGVDTDAYRVRVLGEFPHTATDAIIPIYVIEEAIQRETYNPHNARVWGVDYADAGDDKTMVVKRVGNYFHEKLSCPVEGAHRQSQTAAWLAWQYRATPEEKRPKAIYVDAIGEGSGLISTLNEPQYSDIPVVAVKVSNAAVNSEVYNNLRTELYYRLKSVLEDEGKMFDDDDTIGELAAHRFTFTERGKLQATHKKDIKVELGRSPDTADAMVLTCYGIIPSEKAPVDELHDLDYIDDYDDNEDLVAW